MDGRRLAALAVSMIVLVGCRGAAAPSAAAGPVLADIGAGLQGPPGLAATVYAQGLPKVSAFAWDAQGALWMASADYTDGGWDGGILRGGGVVPARRHGPARGGERHSGSCRPRLLSRHKRPFRHDEPAR